MERKRKGEEGGARVYESCVGMRGKSVREHGGTV